MSVQMTLWDISEPTGSEELAAGNTPSPSPAGPPTAPSGPARVLANPSARPASGKARPITATSGLSGFDSSPSADLTRCLASRLIAGLDVTGSPEYRLIWKRLVMPSGLPLLTLRASARPISASACTGWPTPAAQNGEGGPAPTVDLGNRFTLQTAALLTGWNTPTAQDGRRGGLPARPWDTGTPLSQQAALVGWNTPRATDGSNGGPNQAGGALCHDATLAGWPTPLGAPNAPESHRQSSGRYRQKMARLTGWATPTVTDSKSIGKTSQHSAIEKQARGQPVPPSFAPTADGGAYLLNPRFSLWLQGYPAAWACCAERAIASSRSSRRRSSEPTSKPSGS